MYSPEKELLLKNISNVTSDFVSTIHDTIDITEEDMNKEARLFALLKIKKGKIIEFTLNGITKSFKSEEFCNDRM